MTKKIINSSYTYRKIWKQFYGNIPKDHKGRSMEIHHINGNHDDNQIENLKLVTIDEHYDIHHTQEDWGACMLIAKRMKKTPEELSLIQKGKKRNLPLYLFGNLDGQLATARTNTSTGTSARRQQAASRAP